MTARPGRAGRTRAALLVAAAGLVGATFGAGPALAAPAGITSLASAAPAPVRAAVPASVGTLLLDRMTTVLRPGAALDISGRLRLPAAQAGALPQAKITLLTGPALGSRNALHSLRDTPGTSATGNMVGTSVPVDAGGRFQLHVPADIAPWRDAGVYPLTLTAQAPLTTGTTQVATLVTFLPYFPDGVAQPAKFTVVVPVTDQPSLVSPGTLATSRTLAQIAHGGRLERLLGFSDSPTERTGAAALTLAVDSALTDTLATMGSAWRDLAAASTRPADPAAGATLSRLEQLPAAGTLLLPYGDADVTGLAAAGRPDHLANAVRTARTHLPADLPVPPSASTIALPPGGCTTPAGFTAYAAAGVTAAIVDEACVPLDPTLTYTPSAHTRVLLGTRPLDLLVTDGELDRLISTGPSIAATPRAAEQLFLAETAMIVLEQPNLPRALIVTVPRTWNPPSGWLPTILRDTTTVPWLSAASAQDVLASPEVARGTLQATDPAALPVGYLDQVAAGQGLLAGLCTMLPAKPASLRADCELPWTFLGPESAAFRTDLPAGRRLLADLEDRARTYNTAVHVAASPEVTLTSRSGKVPVVLENELAQPVTVQLQLEARDRSRLSSATVVTRTLRAKQKVQVEIQVHAESAGRFPVLLSLLTPAGTRLGTPLQITVRSTAYGELAIAITVGAVGVLFLAVLIRAGRRLAALRARRRAAATGGTG